MVGNTGKLFWYSDGECANGYSSTKYDGERSGNPMYDIALTHYPYAKRGSLEKQKTSNLEYL